MPSAPAATNVVTRHWARKTFKFALNAHAYDYLQWYATYRSAEFRYLFLQNRDYSMLQRIVFLACFREVQPKYCNDYSNYNDVEIRLFNAWDGKSDILDPDLLRAVRRSFREQPEDAAYVFAKLIMNFCGSQDDWHTYHKLIFWDRQEDFDDDEVPSPDAWPVIDAWEDSDRDLFETVSRGKVINLLQKLDICYSKRDVGKIIQGCQKYGCPAPQIWAALLESSGMSLHETLEYSSTMQPLGQIILDLAILYDMVPTAQWLVSERGVDPSQQLDGCNSLSRATLRGSWFTLKWLMTNVTSFSDLWSAQKFEPPGASSDNGCASKPELFNECRSEMKHSQSIDDVDSLVCKFLNGRCGEEFTKYLFRFHSKDKVKRMLRDGMWAEGGTWIDSHVSEICAAQQFLDVKAMFTGKKKTFEDDLGAIVLRQKDESSSSIGN